MKRLFIAIPLAAIAGACIGLLIYWIQQTQFNGNYSSPNLPAQVEIPPVTVGVMIENELMARPYQSGLSSADVVYEAPTEGGITRFLAIFGSKYDGKVGPVRSVRSYFLDFAHEYMPIFAHVGGHDDALKRLRNDVLHNADQFFFENYFKRENVGKTALEHTMFTTIAQLRKLAEDKKWETPPLDDSKRKSVNASALTNYPPATKINVDFGFPTYRVLYLYDTLSGTYLRSQAKKPHIDHENETQIAPSAVIVQSVKSWSNNDVKGSISITTIGSGNATVFEGGRAIPATWLKKSLNEPTLFFNAEGDVVPLPAGKIWIEIVPTANTFSYE